MNKKRKYIDLQSPPPISGEKSFYTSINKAIIEGQHVDQLKDIIREYEDYRHIMSEVFIKGEREFDQIFKFRVTYLLKKPVWREFEVDGYQSLDEFADGIVDSMDWDNDHLHAFFFSSNKRRKTFPEAFSVYSINGPGYEGDQYPTYMTDEINIPDIDYEKHSKMKFAFDFGDGHLFDVEYIGKRPSAKNDEYTFFPKVIDQRGVGPEQYTHYD